MKPVEVGEVLTPSQLAQVRRCAEIGVRIAERVGRKDIAARLTKNVNELEEQTCQVYPTK